MAPYDDSPWPMVLGIVGAAVVVLGVLALLRYLDDARPAPVAVRRAAPPTEPPAWPTLPPVAPEEDLAPGAAEEPPPVGGEPGADPARTADTEPSGDPARARQDSPSTVPEPGSAPLPAASREPAPAREPTAVPTLAPEATAVPTAAPEPTPLVTSVPAPDPEPEPRESAFQPPYELRLRATAREVWVWVSADGGPRRAVSLEQGETATFEAEQGFELTVDDAGGVDATLNGTSLGSFGPRGQARRDIVLPPAD